MPNANAREPVQIFISYAHEDQELLDELVRHLANLQRQGLIRNWHDHQITPGSEWRLQISDQLEHAQIVLLLVSADFIASDYCYDVEMTRALEMHDSKRARVVPIILRPVDWHGTPFHHLQALPANARPVTQWPSRDQAWENVARNLRIMIDKWQKRSVIEQRERYR